MPAPIQLPDDQIMRMRSDYAAGLSQHKIAAKYGVHKNVARRIVEDIPSGDSRQKIHKCPACPMLFYFRNTARKFCSDACRIRHQQQERMHRMDEFKWIAGTDSWENIAARLELSGVQAMREWLRKYGETAWAERVTRETTDRPRQGQWAA